MQITMPRARPAWPAKTKLSMTLDCSRIAKEIAIMSGIFVEGRRQASLYSCKRQEVRSLVPFCFICTLAVTMDLSYDAITLKEFWFCSCH